jgi:hypothetical protein
LGFAEGTARRPVGAVGWTNSQISSENYEKTEKGERTSFRSLVVIILASKLNIDEINLQLLVGLDANQERRTTASRDNLVREVRGLENKSERTLELLQNGLDQLSEGEAPGTSLRVKNIFGQDSDGLGIGVGLELVSALLQNLSQLSAVGYDTVVNEHEFAFSVRADRVTVTLGRGAMGSPSCMRDGDLGNAGFLDIEVGAGDPLAETGDFADFLEIFH